MLKILPEICRGILLMIDPSKPYDLIFSVTPAYAPTRLDLFVKAMVPSMSRSKIQRYCAAKKILVNGEPRAQNWIVQLGDHVLLSCREPENIDEAIVKMREKISSMIIFEDDEITVLNKPAGWVVHPVGKHRHDTLLNALFAYYINRLPDDCEISLVNRLDQFTSGVILAAKTLAAKRNLQDQFENRRVQKIYYALVKGLVADDRGIISLPVGPAIPGQNILQAVRHDQYGKTAQTEYEVLERFPSCSSENSTADSSDLSGITFLRLQPHTGRQHQLRLHLAAIGHPFIADANYGNAAILRFADGTELARYPLHAAELFFTHPISAVPQHVSAPLADDFLAALERLRAHEKYEFVS